MKHLITALAASAILMTSAMAQKIGVTLSAFEHQFLVKVREAMTEKAKELGVQIQFVEVRAANALEAAFDEVVQACVQALVVLQSPMFNAQTRRLADLRLARGR